MELKNDTLGASDVVFMLLGTLKSNGTFDEIRRHCITEVDAKPTYQNWKQRIESNVNKFLSKVKYTPELNKNAVRERLRKYLLDGCDTQDIEEGADRILTQVLEPRSLSIFESKIAVAVDEYLGIKNKAPPIELNDTDNIACEKLKGDRKDLRSDKKEKSSSPCKESKFLKGNQSEDENDAGRSSKQKSSQHKTSISDKSKSSSSNHKSNKKDNSCKEVVEKSKNTVEKYEDVIDNPKDPVKKFKDVSKPKGIVDKFKDIVNKPIETVDKPKDIVEKSKDNVNKPKDIVDKSMEKSFLLKNFNSYTSSHKSHQTDRKRIKRPLEEKKKSSSHCKEPKLLNGNQSDDESNSGGSSKQKIIINKNNSSSSDKTKSSSSNHKSIRRDNNSTDIADKSKDKHSSKNLSCTDIEKLKDKSLSKNSTSCDIDMYKNRSLIMNSSSSHKSNHTDNKRLKLSPVEKNKSLTNKVCNEERKPEEQEDPEKSEWNDFQSFIHSNNDIDVIMKDSASTLILHKEIENNSAIVLDDDKSLYTFKGFSEADAIPCKNYKLLKNLIKTLQVQMNDFDKIDNGFKGFTGVETNPCKHRNNVYAELIKLKESKSSTGFIGFSEEDTAMSIGHKYVVKQIESTQKQNNVDNHQQNVKCSGNEIQIGKKYNEVMVPYSCKSNNDNDAKSKENYSKPINNTKNDSPIVNNNHNRDSWVVEQEIKYKLLPVKVKLERLIVCGCNNSKCVSESPQVPLYN